MMRIEAVPVFFHPLNLLLLLSAVVTSAWTVDIRALVVGAVVEAIWLSYGPSWSDRLVQGEAYPVDDQEQVYVRSLTEPLRERFLGLDHLRHEIRQVVLAEPLAASVGLDKELEKLDGLVTAWLQLAVRWSRQRQLEARRRSVGIGPSGSLEDRTSPRSSVDPTERQSDKGLAADGTESSDVEARVVPHELQRVEEALGTIRDTVHAWSQPDAAVLSQSLSELCAGIGAAGRTLRDVQALDGPPDPPTERLG
ncbi:MAG: hypothetical protein KTR25_03645 [Myxococcales bacterium]|nr:hypothetical protein [Myxococcales bacterium]